MDKIHRPDELPFVSPEMNLLEWAANSLDAAGRAPPTSSDPELAGAIGCDQELIDELADVCNPANVMCGGESDDPLYPAFPLPPDTELQTLKVQKEELKLRQASLAHRQMQQQHLKYRRFNFRMANQYAAEAASGSTYVPNDFVLTVTLLKPYNRPLEHHEIRLGRLLSLDCAYYVLGSQKLTDLRDRISCLCDYAIPEDYADNPDKPQDVLAKDLYNSGFFYVNGVFYNDMRDPLAQDLSKEIMEWAETGSRKRELGPFRRARMEDTRFVDLKVRFGIPYVYQHQGSCQHLLVFSDIRLMHQDDCQNIDDYPLLVSTKMNRRIACAACKLYTAKWVTYGNLRLPFDPGFFCDTCFRSFNYDQQGNKIGQFSAYPYIDRHALN